MNNPTNPTLFIKCPTCQAEVSRQAVFCPRCGQPFQSVAYQQQPLQANLPLPVGKKSGIGKIFAIGCLGLIIFVGVVNVIGSILFSKSRLNQNPSTQPSQIEKNPTPQEVTKKPIKRKTKEQRIQGGLIELNDEEGNPRPYSLKCFKELSDLKILDEKKIPKGIKTAIYERCLDLNGNATQAVQDMIDVVK
jgi:hypothetical protein